jgi:hypothetical protein
MQPEIIRFLREFFAFGAELNRELPGDVREASESNWDAEIVGRIITDVKRHFRTASRIANWLTLLTCVPLLFFILCQVLSRPPPWIVIPCLGWVFVLCVLSIYLIGSLVGTAQAIHELPGPVNRELMGPLWRNLDFLFAAICFDLFAYVFPPWKISTTLFIFVLLAFLWISAPWAILAAKQAATYIKIRIAQLAVLVVVSFICAASPIPMQHFQWSAQRELVRKIRPFEETEVTTQWRTLEWFSQEGASNIWYSMDPNGDYHLFSTPGTDKQTGEQLKSVSDAETKNQIIKKLEDEETTLKRKMALEQKLQLAEHQASAAKVRGTPSVRQGIG